MYSNKEQRLMTFCALDHMSDATQHHGLGWGGVGMMTFCALDHMSDATQHHGLGWGGLGMMTFYALELSSPDIFLLVGCAQNGSMIFFYIIMDMEEPPA